MKQGEENFFIAGSVGALQSIVMKPEAGTFPVPRGLAILCHPHPLHQGTLENKVVTTLAKATRAFGCVTVRFNFRGVGKSEGSFDEGRGEQDDCLAVMQWAQKKYGDLPLYLGGFSFGAYIALKVSLQVRPQKLLLISPPVLYEAFKTESLAPPCPTLVVQGTADIVVPALDVEKWVADLRDPRLVYCSLPGVGHYFHGHLMELQNLVSTFLQ